MSEDEALMNSYFESICNLRRSQEIYPYFFLLNSNDL